MIAVVSVLLVLTRGAVGRRPMSESDPRGSGGSSAWSRDLFDNQFRMTMRKADAIPDEGKQRIWKPVQPS